MISHMVDWQLFGSNAGGHHLVSAVIHAVNGAILLVVLLGMTGAFWRSAAVAAVFALHPLRVESVAWAAERKDVLSAFFWLLALAAWLRWVRRPAPARYLAAMGLFAAALAAKPMAVTFPLVLLLLDWWPLGRAAPMSRTAGAPGRGRRTPFGLVFEKSPLLLLSLAASLVTLKAQTTGVIPMAVLTFPARLSNALVSIVVYLRDLSWPAALAILYPFPPGGVPTRQVAAAAAILTVMCTAVVLERRRPYLVVGWLWYLVMLMPIIGLVQVGAQSRADRYTYLPLVGVTMGALWLAGDFWPRSAAARRVAASVTGLLFLALTAATSAQIDHWRSEHTIYEHTARVTKDNYLILNNFGVVQENAGRLDDAVRTYSEVIRIDPEHCNGYYNRASVLVKQRRLREAEDDYRRALSCYQRQGMSLSWVADAYCGLAAVLLDRNRPAEAEQQLQALLGLDPGNQQAARLLAAARADRASHPRLP